MKAGVPGGLFGSLPSEVKLLVFSVSPNGLTVGYFMVYLTGYLPSVNVSASLVGTLVAIEGIMLVFAGIPLGILSDRIGRKWILIASSLGIFPATLLFALTTNVELYAVGAALFGLVEAGTLSSWNAIIADSTVPSNRTSAFSLSFVVSTTFTAAGYALPLAFPGLQAITGLSTPELHVGTLTLLAITNLSTPAILVFLLRHHSEAVKRRQPGEKRNLGIIAKFTLMNGVIGFGAGLIIPLVPTWFYLKFGMPDSVSGPVLAVSGMTIGAAAIASPRLARGVGQVRSIVLTTGSSTVFMLSLALVGNVVAAGAVYVVRSALMNMAGPLLDSFIMGQVLPEERGFTSAANGIIWRLPNSVSSFIGGTLLALGFYDLPWLLASAFYVAGITSFYLAFRNSEEKG